MKTPSCEISTSTLLQWTAFFLYRMSEGSGPCTLHPGESELMWGAISGNNQESISKMPILEVEENVTRALNCAEFALPLIEESSHETDTQKLEMLREAMCRGVGNIDVWLGSAEGGTPFKHTIAWDPLSKMWLCAQGPTKRTFAPTYRDALSLTFIDITDKEPWFCESSK